MWDDLAGVGSAVITVEGTQWTLVGAYEQARSILQDGVSFTSSGERILLETVRGRGGASTKGGGSALPPSLLSFREDKESRGIRKSLRQGLDELPAAFEEDASLFQELETRLAVTECVDLSETALSLSTTSMSLLLGVPARVTAVYEAWIRDGGRRITDTVLHQRVTAALTDAQSGLMAGLLSRGWSAPDAAWALVWLSRASVRTLARALCNTFQTFSFEPGLPQFLDAGSDVNAAVNEILRLNPPTSALGRLAVGEQEVGGRIVPDGSLVVPVLAAAQRDRSVFPAGAVFRPENDGRPLLAFGWGRHSCLGETVARSLLAVVVAFIRDRRLAFESAGPAVRHPSFCFSSWDRLPTRITRLSRSAG